MPSGKRNYMLKIKLIINILCDFSMKCQMNLYVVSACLVCCWPLLFYMWWNFFQVSVCFLPENNFLQLIMKFLIISRKIIRMPMTNDWVTTWYKVKVYSCWLILGLDKVLGKARRCYLLCKQYLVPLSVNAQKTLASTNATVLQQCFRTGIYCFEQPLASG